MAPATATLSTTTDAALERKRAKARRRFLSFYPGGFDDPGYLDLERGYKERAHEAWTRELSETELARLDPPEIARRAVRIEGRTNLLFSFEKMALRDALKTRIGARAFAEGIVDLLYGGGDADARFERWIEAIARLPKKQTRVFTWPVVTVFPFIADPKRQLYLKPLVTKAAAERWGSPFVYRPGPSTETYRSLLAFGRDVRGALPGRRARDQIDVQGFIWVLGSTEYD